MGYPATWTGYLYLCRVNRMARMRRPSAQATALVMAMARDPTAWRYGYDLCRELGIKPGTMYPILMRLSDRGWLDTAWEAEPTRGRPPRHLYRLTADGLAWARSADAPATAARPQPA
jgi:PadR family transcriptional regulator, regulatory protein PadR